LVVTFLEIKSAKAELSVLKFIATKTQASKEEIEKSIRKSARGPGSAKSAIRDLRLRREISEKRKNTRVSQFKLTRKGLCRLIESLNEDSNRDQTLFHQITLTHSNILPDVFRSWPEITKRKIEDIMIPPVQYFCGNYHFVAEDHDSTTADKWLLPTSRDVIPYGLLMRFVNSKGRRRTRIARVLRESTILLQEVTRILLSRAVKTTLATVEDMKNELQVFPKHRIKLTPDVKQASSMRELRTALEALDSDLNALLNETAKLSPSAII